MNYIMDFRKDGAYRWLSNFWPCTIKDDNGLVFPSVENAYQAAKCDDSEDMLQFTTCTPGQAKRLGRKVLMRLDWNAVRDMFMLEYVRQKFTLNADLTRLLLATGNARIEEGNSWGDYYWGISPAGSGRGQNKLGKIIMQVREELK